MVQSADSGDQTPLGMINNNVEFFQKVSRLPVVTSALSYASEAYGKAKESTPYIIQKTITTAEDTVKFAAEKTMPLALPVVASLPVHMVDTIACKTLDKVEERLPVVTKTPEEIIKTTKEYVNEKLQPTYERVEAVKSTVTDATERVLTSGVGKMALGSVLTALDKADHCVDYLLPGREGRGTKATEEAVDRNGTVKPLAEPPTDHGNERLTYSVNRSVGIVKKVQNRVLNTVADSINYARSTGTQIFESLGISIDMLISLRNMANPVNMASISVRRLSELYHQLTDEEMPKEVTTDDLKGRTLRLARVLTRQLMTVTQRAINIAASLPGAGIRAVRDQIDVAAVFVAETAAQFLKATRLEAISSDLLATIKTQLPIVYNGFIAALDFSISSLVFLFPGLRESLMGTGEGIKARIEEAASTGSDKTETKITTPTPLSDSTAETTPRRRRTTTPNSPEGYESPESYQNEY